MKSGIIILVILLSVFCEVILAQQIEECGTTIPPGVTVQQAQSGNLGLYKRTTTTPPLRLAIHIVRYSNGTGGIPQPILTEKLDSLYSIMSQALFEFSVYKTDYIDSDYFANINTYEKANELRLANAIDGCINIYFVPQMFLNGLSSFSSRIQDPGLFSEQGIIVRNGAPFTTLPHEMGHYFDLFHTFEIYFGYENIARAGGCANWNSKGDFLQDTPADPSGRVSFSCINNNCEWDPLKALPPDGCGQTNYNPLTNNMMITELDICRTSFTQNQKDRMNETLLTYRSELLKYIVYLENSANLINAGGTLHLGGNNYNSGTPAFVNTGTYATGTNNERFDNFQGSGSIYKHNNWNEVFSDFILSRNIYINSSINQIGKFNKLNTATVRNAYDGVGFNDGKVIMFNDPWYVKDQYNNQSGMGDFISFQSPYYPTGKYNQSTGGVFLNQPYTGNNPVYYSVKIPQAVQDIYMPQTGKYHKFYFQGWSGTEVQFQNNSTLQTGVVFKDDIQGVDPVVNANLKGTQLSGNTNGFSNSSQRKFIATLYPQYFYHLVYSSGGSVWYEKALMNSEVVQPLNWQLMNNAKPLNGDFFYTEGKSPSIDFCYATHGGTEENYFIYIVYQKKKSDNNYEIRLSKFNQSGVKIFDIQVFSSAHTDYSTFDCMPVVGVSRQKDDLAPIKVVVLWRRPAEDSATAGLYYVAGFDQGSSINWTDNYPTGYKISTTDLNSINPSLAVFKSPFANISYHLAYQQGTSQIKYTDIIFGVNGTTAETPVVISTGSGSSTNITPSITVHNTRIPWPGYEREYDSPKVVWCTGYEGCGVYRTKPNKSAAWSPFYVYLENDDVQSPTISGPKYHPSGMDDIFHFGWSWLAGYYKSYVSTSNLALKRSLPYSGTNIQIANNMMEWDGFGYCVLNNFFGTSAPFTFQNKWVEDGLYKPGNNIQAGRAGTIIKDEAEFYFALGDIRLNDGEIDFVTISDTLAIIYLNDLNSSLVTESFEVNDNTLLNYSIFYGFNDSLLAYNSLSESDQIDFKVEIIDDQTLQVLGVHHNIAQLKQDLKVLENTSYQVNMQGIGNRSIRLRLTAGNNFESDYSLSNIYSFNQNLGKENINLLKWDGSEVITEYALDQNYPNPFNPSTTIRYQLPQDGMVTLKVYDILGSEVATLVNEQKTAGRYEINFDASRFASGVYIYKLQAGSFISSKKMLLVK